MDQSPSSPLFLASSTPVRTEYPLCDDILLYIFRCCNEARLGNYTVSDYGFLSKSMSPWVLSHVCHRWRALVVSSPLLWNSIEIFVPDFLYNPRPAFLSFRLAISLERSKNLDLNVEIFDMKPEYYDEESEEEIHRKSFFHSLIPLLLSITPRLRHFQLATHTDIFKLFAGPSFQRLQSLSICQWMDGYEFNDQLTLFKNAPLLTKLAVQGETKLDLQWNRIKTFTANTFDVPDILPRMVNLSVLHIIEGQDSDTDLDPYSSSFVLPQLRAITMRVYHSNRTLLDLPRCLRAPALETLEIIISNDPNGPQGLHFIHLPLFDIVDNLVNLSIDYLNCLTDNTVVFLTKLPSITTLYLGPGTARTDVLAALGRGVLPRLTKICLHFSTMKVYAEEVLSMFESRARCSVTPISKLSFARLRPSFEGLGSPPGKSGYEELSREDLGLDGELRNRWVALRESVDVYFIERHSFDFVS